MSEAGKQIMDHWLPPSQELKVSHILERFAMRTVDRIVHE